MIQLTILKISKYGPWTLTLGSDREHELQMLQASLYKEIQQQFSSRNGIVFLNRCDEFVAISNGLSLDDHISIQKHLESKFDLRLVMSIGFSETPFGANLKAHEARKNSIILNKEHNIFGSISNDKSNISIMHLDVEELTKKCEINSPYEISMKIFQLYSQMSKFFLEYHALSFFMGGDNFMIVTTCDQKESARKFIDLVKQDDMILNCGIGTAKSARDAIKLATKSLDTIREIRDSGKEKPDIYEL